MPPSEDGYQESLPGGTGAPGQPPTAGHGLATVLPKIFMAVADAVEWIARSAGIQWIGHYLDDFLLAGRPNLTECQLALEQLLQQLGVRVAQDKTEGPSPVLTFLGIEINTLAMEVCLPKEKLQSLQALLGEWILGDPRVASMPQVEYVVREYKKSVSAPPRVSLSITLALLRSL